MEKVDCHALQGKARNDRKASFLNTPQDFFTRLQRILGFAMRNLCFASTLKGAHLGCVTAESVKRSKIYRAKPNPPAKR